MEDKEFLIKKVEVLESAIKQMAVIQYELDKKIIKRSRIPLEILQTRKTLNYLYQHIQYYDGYA